MAAQAVARYLRAMLRKPLDRHSPPRHPSGEGLLMH
jgi:hypothetical protein